MHTYTYIYIYMFKYIYVYICVRYGVREQIYTRLTILILYYLSYLNIKLKSFNKIKIYEMIVVMLWRQTKTG